MHQRKCSATASTATGALGCTALRCRLRAKLVYGERHGAEYAAGIVLLYSLTFLFGNAIFSRLNQILRGTYDAYDGKDTDRNGEEASATLVIKMKRRIEGRYNRLRQVVFAAASAATVALRRSFHDLRSKQYGVYDLDDRGGGVLFATGGLGTIAEMTAGIALIDVDVAFTAIEDYALFEDCDSIQLLRSAATDASLDANLDIKANGNRIKATVELNGLNVDIRRNDLGTFCTDRARMLQNLVSKIRQVYANVLVAITVPTRIQDSVRVDADGISTTRRTARESIFCHTVISFTK